MTTISLPPPPPPPPPQRRRYTMRRTMFAFAFLSVVATFIDPATAEIRGFSGPINAASNYVHYSEGYIVAPGFIDLSGLVFTTSDDDDGEPNNIEIADDAVNDDDSPNITPTEPVPVKTKPTKASTPATPKAAPATPKATPATPKVAPVVPKAAPVVPKVPPATPKVAPKAAPAVPKVAPKAAPVTPKATPVVPKAAPVTPKAAPVTPKAAPVTPKAAPVVPKATPVVPKVAPVVPKVAPVAPKAAPAAPKVAPATPKIPPVAPKVAPVAPKAAPVAPKAAPATPKAAPVAPKAAPVAPKAAPVAPKAAPVAPKAAPVAPKAAPEAPKVTTKATVKKGGGRHSRELDFFDSRSSAVDIVLFHQPKECSKSTMGCDWTELGVGASDDGGNLRWCCSGDAIDLGMCKNEMYGRLILNTMKFHGQHHFFMVPPFGSVEKRLSLDQQIFDVKNESGKYVMIVANCDDYGRNLTVGGNVVWKSQHGYLPGDLFGEMYFFLFITVFYLILFMMYGFGMHFHRDATIPIQKWMLLTIGLGFLETFFKGGDYYVWNEDGTRILYAMYTGVVVGAIKRGISRSLVVMVSLGWGVVRDTLDEMWKIIAMGVLYIVVSGTSDVMTDVAFVDYKTLSYDTEEELFDVITVLTFFVAVIDATFYIWILDSLSATMQYLEEMHQTRKLLRYLRLRCLLLLSIVFAVVWAVFCLVNKIVETAILEEDQEWAVRSVWELNYLMILVGVAILWMPNAHAKDYAFVMELPSMGDEVEFDTNADTIDDDDDNDEDGMNGGYKDSPHVDDDELDFAREKA